MRRPSVLRRGFTFAEVLIATGVGVCVLAALATTLLFTANYFRSLAADALGPLALRELHDVINFRLCRSDGSPMGCGLASLSYGQLWDLTLRKENFASYALPRELRLASGSDLAGLQAKVICPKLPASVYIGIGDVALKHGKYNNLQALQLSAQTTVSGDKSVLVAIPLYVVPFGVQQESSALTDGWTVPNAYEWTQPGGLL